MLHDSRLDEQAEIIMFEKGLMYHFQIVLYHFI